MFCVTYHSLILLLFPSGKLGVQTLIFGTLTFWLLLLLRVGFCKLNMKSMLLQILQVCRVSALWPSL